jgi:hypothetical protein
MPAGERINRALWTFRAIVALIALGLLAMILHPQTFRAEPSRPPILTTARGFTAQRVPIAMRFDRPGHPVAFSTRIHGRCSHAGLRDWDWDWGWWPVDSDLVRFHRNGDALRVVQIDDRTFEDGSFGQVVLSMRASAAPGRTDVRGWVRVFATFYYPDGPMTCRSQRVPFAVPARRATSAHPS